MDFQHRPNSASYRPESRPRPGLCTFLFVTLTVFSACTREEDPTLRIGLIIDGTLEEATAERFAAGLAIEEAMEAGGVEIAGQRRPVKLFVADTGGSPEGALQGARQLIARDRVMALIGPNRSRDALAVAPIVEQMEILMLSPKSTHPAVTENRQWVFRLVVTDSQQGRLLAQFARRDLGATTAGLLYDAADAYGRTVSQAFSDSFEADGGKLVAVQAYTTGVQDFDEYLRVIVTAEPDVLFLPGYDETVRHKLRQAQAMGLDTLYLGSDGWSPLTAASSDEYPTFFSQHWFYDTTSEDPRVQDFVTSHQQSLGYPPYDLAALTYDAFGLLFEALSHSPDESPRSIRDTLANMVDYPGLTGSFTFRGRGGDPLKPLLILQSTPRGAELHRLLSSEVASPTSPVAIPVAVMPQDDTDSATN